MNDSHQDPEGKSKWPVAVIFGLLIFVAAAVVWWLHPTASSLRGTAPLPSTDVALARTNLVLMDGRLWVSGQKNPFTGLMIEYAANGSLRSRSAISNGLPHGLSEGWHTNGQLQVSEHFREGVSQGLRTKWYASGAKQSEANIAEGKLNGTFRRWHENGALAEQVELVDGQPAGISLSYFPSGSLKARVVLKSGRPVEREFWKDGERRN
jgi:antitoxin component YwqK of YwqJK toxin-antitoxin module